MLVVLDALTPAERPAFVLHDVFAVPHDEIATILDRSSDAVRKLASRARQRVQGTVTPDSDLARQSRVVDAFLAAAQDANFKALLEVLNPDVILRADGGDQADLTKILRGSRAVADQASHFARFARYATPVLVSGTVGVSPSSETVAPKP